MNIPINAAAAQYLDHSAKARAREIRRQSEQVAKDRVHKCNCAKYKSPFKDCPDCGVETWRPPVQP